jgi:hypothetical protein
MRHRIKVIVATLFMLTQFSGVAQGMSQPSKFSSCKSVLSVYPSGIAKNKVSAGLYPAKISAPLYQANKKFDFDKDGIICEKEFVQSALTTTTSTSSTTTTTTLVGMKGGSVAPAGTWEDNYIYDTTELLYGKGYRLHVCAGGSIYGSTSLEVQIDGQWIKKALSVNTTPSSFCGATYPILHSYYWIIDAPGSSTKYSAIIRLSGFTTTNERARTIVKSPTSTLPASTGTAAPSSGSGTTATVPATATTVFSPSVTTIFGRPFLSNGYWILPNIENAPGFTSIQAFVGGSWVTVGFSASSSSFGIQASVPDTFGFNVAFRHIREVYSVTTGKYEIVQIWNRSGSSGY